MVTKSDLEEYFATRPIAHMVYDSLKELNAQGFKPLKIELIAHAYGDDFTPGERASGYAIIMDLLAKEFITQVLVENAIRLQIAGVQ